MPICTWREDGDGNWATDCGMTAMRNKRMRTRIYRWIDLKTMRPAWGVQVSFEPRKWLHATNNETPLLYWTKERAEQARKEIEQKQDREDGNG